MQYFTNIKSFQDLKDRFKELARANHPDAGGNEEIMKAINREYDELFPIWRNRHNKSSETPVTETADSTRSEFYTENGWAGSNYDINRSTKEICQIIRAYVKEVYPTYKFSVRFMTASMCSEIYVKLVNSPIEIYKTWEELTQEERFKVWQKAETNRWVEPFGCLDDEHEKLLKEAYQEHSFLKVYNEATKAVIDDVDQLVNSYRYEDIDSMIDYFNVSDYYFGVSLSDKFAVVPKTARIKEPKNEVGPSNGEAPVKYEVNKTEHTKTHEPIWTVKLGNKLGRDEYLREAEKMKSLGGYYSRYVHAFVFKEDPTARLAS